MKTFTFGYGHRTEELSLPEEKILQVFEGKKRQGITDVKEAIKKALREPIGSEPLQKVVKKGEKVCIIVSDITRVWIRTKDFLLDIVNELNLAGVIDENIWIVIAQGTHRAQTHEEDIKTCGEEVVKRIKIYQHNSKDEETLEYLGETTRKTPIYIDKRVLMADKVILTGGITAHLMAGFGGGRKSIMPGVAGFETVSKNHSWALTDELGGGSRPNCASGVLENNPLHLDMCEIAEKINPCFLVNSIIDENGEFFNIVGGHWYEAWLEGTRDVLSLQGVVAKGKADVVIASPGGYPKDINLYQGCKTFDASGAVLKKGGILIAMLECEDIKEPPEFMASFHYSDLLEFEKDVRKNFTIPFYIAFTIKQLTTYNTCYLVTKKENFDSVRATGLIPVETAEEAWALAKKKLEEENKTDYTINVLAHAANVIPTFEK